VRIVDDYLKDFARLETLDGRLQAATSAGPGAITRSYSAGESRIPPQRHVIHELAASQSIDVEMNLAFHALEYILLGMPASPLRKALMESGWGKILPARVWSGNCARCTFPPV